MNRYCLQKQSFATHLQQARGFTLIELLVTVTIIGLLAGLGIGGYNAAMNQARKSKEIGAAKKLVTSYLLYPLDHNGAMMKGYDNKASSVKLPNGTSVSGPAVQRYPWRLASYFDFDMQGSILVNKNASQVDNRDSYMVSLYPALGMNAFYIGGYQDEGNTIAMEGDAVTYINQTLSPLLVFASAYYGNGNKESEVDGFHLLTPPYKEGPMWSDSNDAKTSSNAEDFGHVDFRYGNKAVCAFLDGSVKLNGVEELRDMRLWNQNAALADNASYTVQKQGSSGTGGGGGRGRGR